MGEQDTETRHANSPVGLYKPPSITTAKERILAFPAHIHLGEQIVGSSHLFDVVVPHAPGGEHAIANVSIEDANALQTTEGFAPADVQHSTLSPIPIRFSPKVSGPYAANVVIMLRWSDGLSEQRRIRVHANARTLEEAPRDAIAATEVKKYTSPGEAPSADLSKVDGGKVNTLNFEAKLAAVKARTLGNNQMAGVVVAEKNAANYKRGLPEGDWWSYLAELAVIMAVGGTAGMIGKFTGETLTSVAKTAGEGSKSALREYAKVAITDTVKDGLKNTVRDPLVKQALKLRTVPDKNTKDPKPAGHDVPRVSSNNKTNFFSAQLAGVDKLKDGYEQFVLETERQLQHGLATDPEHAIAAMKAVSAGLDAGAEPMKEAQQRETEWQWTSALARGSVGSETVKVAGEERSVTKVSTPPRVRHVPDGLLTIRVGGNAMDGVTSVQHAVIYGVSRDIADRLLEQDLSRAPIPIRIITDRDIISRDEVGRVRAVTGVDDEPQRIRDAQRLVDAVLANSLRGWGLEEIETDAARS